MRAKDIVGRRIVGIQQVRCSNGSLVYMDVSLLLDNGDRLIPIVGELDGDYAVDFVVNKTGRKKKRRSNGD